MANSAIDFERLASALLSQHGMDQKLPIDVEAVANCLGISVRYEPFGEDMSGVLVKEPNRTTIGVNSSHAITRQRFTIAHEIGHFILKHKGEVFVDKTLRNDTFVVRRDGKSSLGTFLWEIHANQFAAALLMPKNLLLAQISKRLDKKNKLLLEELIAELAKVFMVSKQAMEYRLTNIGSLIPG
jgi:Zn-dependent peptidase ImmA (M78 family)